jgi:hypothetical protein
MRSLKLVARISLPTAPFYHTGQVNIVRTDVSEESVATVFRVERIGEIRTSLAITSSEDHFPFLDIDIYKRAEGSREHRVYNKPTHTILSLNDNLLYYLLRCTGPEISMMR